MGTWGTSISSNDTYADVYYDFFELYNQGLTINEITRRLLSQYHETIADPLDANNFWFALAKASWECRSLEINLLNRVTSIVQSGVDLDNWKLAGASEADLKKRKIVLDEFLEKLSVPRSKQKPRKEKVIRKPVFKKGECLVFKFSNGNYGGAIVLEAPQNTEFGASLIAATRINQAHKPVASDFERAEILVEHELDAPNRFENSNAAISWYIPNRHKNILSEIEIIGSLRVDLIYDPKQHHLSFIGDFDTWIVERIERQFERDRQKPKETITVRQLIYKKPFWKFW